MSNLGLTIVVGVMILICAGGLIRMLLTRRRFIDSGRAAPRGLRLSWRVGITAFCVAIPTGLVVVALALSHP